jgi:hypothetical protein
VQLIAFQQWIVGLYPSLRFVSFAQPCIEAEARLAQSSIERGTGKEREGGSEQRKRKTEGSRKTRWKKKQLIF